MVGSGIRVDRCGCLRRPLRMSAPTDADVCADRCECLRRPMRMVKYAEGVGKKGAWEVWEGCVVCVGGVRGGVRGYGRMPYPPMGVLCR